MPRGFLFSAFCYFARSSSFADSFGRVEQLGLAGGGGRSRTCRAENENTIEASEEKEVGEAYSLLAFEAFDLRGHLSAQREPRLPSLGQ